MNLYKKLPWKRIGFIALGAALLFVVAVLIMAASLPSIEEIDSREITQSTKIYDRTGTVLLYDINSGKKRTLVQPEDIPQTLKDATVAIEDEKFYEEPAFNWKGIVRALGANIVGGGFVQGGSTITQQLAKNAFLTPEKTIVRKIKELILAIRLDQHYSKDKILWLYLNEIPYGPSVYGVEAASQTYFNKRTKELDLAESALLAAIPQSSSYYAPDGNHVPELLRRKDLVLKRMKETGKITEDQYQKAVAEKIKFVPIARGLKAPHFVMAVRDYLTQKYGEDMVRKGGLQVKTTLDWDLQQAAEKAVLDGATNNTKLYKGKNAALVAENATSGQILAMVGSRDYFDTQNEGNFNVATQGLRQPGSSLKPFVYLAGFMKGYTPDTVLFDVPTEFAASCPAIPNYSSDDPSCFHPEDFDHTFRGPISLRSALAQSVNVTAVKMLYLVGLKDSLSLANQFGLTTLNNPARYGLSLVLGGGAVHLSDLVEAYSVLANDGVKNDQSMILEVKDGNGNTLESWSDSSKRVVDSQYTREITDILSDESARAGLFQNSLNLTVFPGYDVALKTGTSNDYRDAWTVGYTPSIVAGVWAGNNDNSPMQRSGSSILAAVPIWSAFMREALKTEPALGFPRPNQRIAEKPVLRGEYAENGQVHTILYFVNKNDPTGAAPSDPSSDPQYLNWETGVENWVSNNPGSISFGNSFSGSGTILSGSGPQIRIITPTDGSFIQNTVYVSADLSSQNDLSEANIFFNQNLIYSFHFSGTKSQTLNYSFSPSNIGQQNQLELELKDRAGKTSRASVIVYK